MVSTFRARTLTFMIGTDDIDIVGITRWTEVVIFQNGQWSWGIVPDQWYNATRGPLAQLAEQGTFNPKVQGSNP